MTTSGPVHFLDELRTSDFPGTNLTVIGHPVAHSFSPAMNNAALADLAAADTKFHSWHYTKFDIEAPDVGEALRLLHARGFYGVNVTAPHKEIALAAAESADEFACAAGAANTLIRTATGWRAYNTDGGGFADALGTSLQTKLAGAPVILLGAGGAARAIALQCVHEGVASLWIGNRSTDRLLALLAQVRPFASGLSVEGFPLNKIPSALSSGAIVVNTTTLGLKADDPAAIDLQKLPHPAAVYDTTYNPLSNFLLTQAAALGIPHANGFSMLVHQGARSLALWTGKPAPIAVMSNAVQTVPGHSPV